MSTVLCGFLQGIFVKRSKNDYKSMLLTPMLYDRVGYVMRNRKIECSRQGGIKWRKTIART